MWVSVAGKACIRISEFHGSDVSQKLSTMSKVIKSMRPPLTLKSCSLVFASMSLLLQVLPALAQQPAVFSFAPASQNVTVPTQQPNVSVVCILDSDGKKCSQRPEAGL